MSKTAFFFSAALNHLRRGGQRTLVALLCVVFGVMSLVAMTTLSKSIEKMLVLEPVELIGGDLTVDREGEDVISAAEEAQLQELQASGQIESYTLMDYTTTLAFHLEDSGKLNFPGIGMGVDPDKYPLAGRLLIREPQSTPLNELLTQPGDVILTRDLALEYHLAVGDALVLTNLEFGRPLAGRVTGIAADTPNHQGNKIYFSHETANLLTGQERSFNTVLVNSADPDTAAKLLEERGWRVFTAENLAEINAATEGVLAMGLNDVGLLSLLVGGIGIANTMQVLLRRRRKEVAVWKTLGYTSGQIQVMFVIEAVMLGLSGSLLGSTLGVLLSLGMVDLFSRTTTVLVQWVFSPVQALAGLAIGTLITVIFAAWAIISTSRVRPLALLRNEALETGQIPLAQAVALGALLAVPFLAICVWVLGSFLTGLLVLFASVAGLALLGGALWLLMRLATRLLPMNLWPLGRISRNNLRKRGSSLVFAMVALFIGVISLGFGAVLAQSGQNVINAFNRSAGVENAAIFAGEEDESVVIQQLEKMQITTYTLGHLYPVKRITLADDSDTTLAAVIEGRAKPGAYHLTGADWGSRADGVYVRRYLDIPVGSKLNLVTGSGQERLVEVIGTFETGEEGSWPGRSSMVLAPDTLASQFTSASSSQFFLTLPMDQVSAVTQQLGQALPQTTVISMPDYQSSFIYQYQNLFVFVAAMAGLAILAGILLVANSVSLAMLDRRYEIGVLKAVGYSRRQVLTTQVVEYTLMAVIVCLVGLGLIWGVLALAGTLDEMLGSLLLFQPLTAALIAGFTIGLTLLTVLAVTWRPTNVSPVLILNDRE